MDDLGAQQARQQHMKRAPMYELGKEGHYGACLQLANTGAAPNPDVYTGPWVNINNGLHGQYREIMTAYWQATLHRLEDDEHDYKQHQLPLARIKKVMKADAEVKMISAEAPILFAKGCDIFITELTMRAWIHAEENKRRTLQRSDIAAALSKSDMYDFLIDIVPREDTGAAQQKRATQASLAGLQQPPSMPAPHMAQQVHGAPHHAPQHEYGYPGHMPPEQDYRQTGMYAPPEHAYTHPPPGMFEQHMYAGYQMPPQQMYQMPPRAHEPTGGPPPAHHHYRPHEGDEAEAHEQGENTYEVGQ